MTSKCIDEHPMRGDAQLYLNTYNKGRTGQSGGSQK